MDIALCYPSVLPSRGGCETYIVDLSRRLVQDGHRVHLYASQWDAAALPASVHFHRIDAKGPRWLKPWRFANACVEALDRDRPDVSLGFDKTWGQDILYPQGGLHVAAAKHNLLKYKSAITRAFASLGKSIDVAYWSYARLEKKQYFGAKRPQIVVNSFMVRRHFEEYYGVPSDSIRVLRSAIDPARFAADDRLRLRHEERTAWGVSPNQSIGLFVAMNYRLKGLEPLLRALPLVKSARVVVAGHPNFARYARLALALGVSDRVTFLGHRPDPRTAYFAADYLVHPTFYDPCSLVALEALACGLPVITTQYNGAAELLNERNGAVIRNPHDCNELAMAIERVSNPVFLRTASAAARITASQLTFEAHYRSLLELFGERVRMRMAA